MCWLELATVEVLGVSVDSQLIHLAWIQDDRKEGECKKCCSHCQGRGVVISVCVEKSTTLLAWSHGCC
jgi:hypothetical protein